MTAVPEVVGEAGLVQGLSNADYHADKEWLSSTVLKRALPYYTDPDDRAALDFGTAFHTRTLGEGEEVVVLDAADWRAKATQEARDEATAVGKVAILRKDSERIDAMIERVHEHKDAAALLFSSDGTSEESAFWMDDSGIKHKARFDRRIPGKIIDLKSTSAKPLSNEELAKVTANYLYDLSAAHYLAVAEGLGLDCPSFAFVFVSKHPPHHVAVCELDAAFLADGRFLREQAIDRIVNGQRGTQTLAPPRWRNLDRPLGAIPSDFTWSINDYA